ncbi:MAG TPA: acyl-CoA thioesterase [Phototrophicaceae bacterium]|jgi:acyl-CoA thioester hydrolase|nr:acyl-CoA thioesterase [Phototrophicaceae bacterium]
MINESVLDLNKELSKELESTVVVRFQDCDPFQHLNNTRYIDYFMNAREDQLLQFYNFRIFDVPRQTNQGWVVSKTQIAYLSPAVMQEQLVIRTHLIQMTETNLVVEGLMLDKAARRLKAVSWIEFTFVSLQTGRPTNHPDDMMNFFTQVVVEGIYSISGFSQRVEELKQQIRRAVTAEA